MDPRIRLPLIFIRYIGSSTIVSLTRFVRLVHMETHARIGSG